MRRRDWLGCALCVALLACGGGEEDGSAPGPALTQSAGQDGARLDLSLDRDSLTTAETALLTLEVECGESDTVEFPDSTDGFGDFAVARDEELRARLLEGGRVVRGRQYVLQPFLPGNYQLPVLEVVLNGSNRIATTPVAVEVRSVLEDPEAAELRDIADPVDMPAPWWMTALAVLVPVATLVALAWWWRRRVRARDAPRPVPPHEAALAALDALLAEDLIARGMVEPFYLRLSDIVRHYIEDRFGLRAPEQTTDEFLAAMAAEPVIGSAHQSLLRDFLRQADLVKFAQFEPAVDEARGAAEAARKLVAQTAPRESEDSQLG